MATTAHEVTDSDLRYLSRLAGSYDVSPVTLIARAAGLDPPEVRRRLAALDG